MPDRFHPIIYLRGFAGSQGEIDDTSADPFSGFNIGSTVYRANPVKEARAQKYIFESPVIRLITEFGYTDVFEDGRDIVDENWQDPISKRSIIICNYYSESARFFGQTNVPTVPQAADKLNKLILKVKQLVVAKPENQITNGTFKCYLVAHSMGGLVCRALLQNSTIGSSEAKEAVAKVFTYGTPHNGIDFDLGILGHSINAPKWLTAADISNFNRENMAEYLELQGEYQDTGRVNWLPEAKFAPKNFFCMVGTNRMDYEVAAGLSRTFVGQGSDGLVRISNATLSGVNVAGKPASLSPRAYAFRSHSGNFGLVNSEETFQNLVRFLFGDLRIDVWLDITHLTLPDEVQKAYEEGKRVDANYQIELTAAARGKMWQLTRRRSEEDSVAYCSHEELLKDHKVYLSTIYLGNQWKVNQNRASMAFKAYLGVKVPDYAVDRFILPDKHYEERYLFRDDVIIEVSQPDAEHGNWKVRYDWQNDDSLTMGDCTINHSERPGELEIRIPIKGRQEQNPQIEGDLCFVINPWNEE